MSLPGFVGSVIEYSTPYNFKRDLEEHFRRKHPDLDPHLTLTSIREIKSSMLTVTRSQDLELSTLAIATVFFEKLILAQHVHKANRKAMAATCMLLAFKVNEPKDTGKTLALLRDLEMELDSDHKRVTGMEFNVFAKLGFELYPAISEFMPHFERIFAGLEYRTMADYLGDTAFFVM
ncbi:hypothetical protein GQ42DRAFT_121411 [Ramicandelaber brevisporus]|nr:hypothetical protein GQ42DRAFT_121411 [Ramicandelaber brevisporus]